MKQITLLITLLLTALPSFAANTLTLKIEDLPYDKAWLLITQACPAEAKLYPAKKRSVRITMIAKDKSCKELLEALDKYSDQKRTDG